MNAIYLKHIRIVGLFGFKDISWDVNRDVNILGGVNGSGKSTVFQICYLLLKWGYINDPRYVRLVKKVELQFSNGYTMTWDKQKVQPRIKREASYSYFNIDSGSVEKDGSIEVQRVKVTDSKGADMDINWISKNIYTSLLSSFEQTILDSKIIEVDVNNDDRTYLDRLLSSHISIRNARVSQILFDSLSHGKENDGGEDHQVAIDKKDISYILQFNHAINKFFGQNYDTRFALLSKLSLISKQTNERIQYQSLSLGEKELLLLIVFVSNTYNNPVILWLDEPDLGLHVDWQERLIPCLRNLNPHMQLFVSTHAPSMVEGNQDRVKEMTEIVVEDHEQHSER